MNTSKISAFLKKTLALTLVGYFSLLSPITALAITQPVSAPVTIPVTIPTPTPAPSPTATPVPVATVSVSPTNVSKDGTITITYSNIPNPHLKDIFQFVTNGMTKIVGFGIWANTCKVTELAPDPTGTPKSSGSCVIDLSKAGIPANTTTLNIVLYSGKTIGQIVAVSNQFTLTNAPVLKSDLTIDLKATVDTSTLGVGTSAPTGYGYSKITLTATVKNIGSVTSQPSVTQINTDNIGINEYWRLATNSLTPGSSQILTITTYKNPGTYQFKAMADADMQINESSEDNNSANISVVVTTPTAPKPDLLVLSAIATGDLKVGSYNDVKITVKNQGNADAKSFWVSANTFDQKTITQLGYCYAYIDKLAAGQTIIASITNCKQYKFPGQQTIYGKVDEFNMVNENNETNNTYLTYATVTIPIPASITSIYGSPAKSGDTVAIYGSGFASQYAKSGSVTLYNQYNQAVAGAPIVYWSDTVVKFTVPFVAKGNYQIEAQTSDGRKSNRVSLTVTAAQPTISSLYTYNLSWGGYFIIYGQDLGKSGKINLYNTNSNVPFYNATILSWSDSLIIGQISPKVGGNATYGFQVSTSDNRQSSLIYRYVSK